MMDKDSILKQLPYKHPFLFVDEISSINEEGVIGQYKLKPEEYFYQGHFPDRPITPGVIIQEIMAQIGLVCLGIFLMDKAGQGKNAMPAFSSASVDYLAPALPGDLLEVRSEKIYFRFGKLKCKVVCQNLTSDKVICKGELSGMMLKPES